MRVVVLALCIMSIPLGVFLWLFPPGCHVFLTRYDLEGYPVYTAYRNGIPMFSGSRSMAESCCRKENNEQD